MKDQKKWKNKNFLEAFKNSIKGIKYVYQNEFNIKIELSMAILAIVFGVIFDFSKIEFLILIITIVLVLFAEFVNTAIEATIDLFTEEFNEKAKIAKDIASSAVLLVSLNSVIIGFIIYGSKILYLLKK